MIGLSTGGRKCWLLLVVGLATAACGSGTGTPVTTDVPSGLPGPTVAVQTGFAGNETFCASSPLTGTIHYAVADGAARLRLAVGGLPASGTVVVNWLNNPIRGYVIGEFAADPGGFSVNSSARLFRPGETRGYQLQLTSSDAPDTVLGELRPCR